MNGSFSNGLLKNFNQPNQAQGQDKLCQKNGVFPWIPFFFLRSLGTLESFASKVHALQNNNPTEILFLLNIKPSAKKSIHTFQSSLPCNWLYGFYGFIKIVATSLRSTISILIIILKFIHSSTPPPRRPLLASNWSHLSYLTASNCPRPLSWSSSRPWPAPPWGA